MFKSALEKTISITAYREVDRLILDVRDSGEGVPESLGNSIFEYAVSENRSTGLGLYLARMLVERNGGSLEYLPLPQGSCFRLVFPAAGEDRRESWGSNIRSQAE